MFIFALPRLMAYRANRRNTALTLVSLRCRCTRLVPYVRALPAALSSPLAAC